MNHWAHFLSLSLALSRNKWRRVRNGPKAKISMDHSVSKEHTREAHGKEETERATSSREPLLQATMNIFRAHHLYTYQCGFLYFWIFVWNLIYSCLRQPLEFSKTVFPLLSPLTCPFCCWSGSFIEGFWCKVFNTIFWIYNFLWSNICFAWIVISIQNFLFLQIFSSESVRFGKQKN